MVNMELRVKVQNRVKTFAKLLISGATVTYSLKDIEKDAYNEYFKDLQKYQMPVTQRRKIAKELSQKDIQMALEEVQRG
jgi:hypothetical protein